MAVFININSPQNPNRYSRPITPGQDQPPQKTPQTEVQPDALKPGTATVDRFDPSTKLDVKVYYDDAPKKDSAPGGIAGLQRPRVFGEAPYKRYEGKPGEDPEAIHKKTGVPIDKIRDTDGDGCYEFNYDDVPPENRPYVEENYQPYMETPTDRAHGYYDKNTEEIPNIVAHVKEIYKKLGPNPTLAQVREFIQEQYTKTYEYTYKKVYKDVYDREIKNGKSDAEARATAETEADKAASDCAAAVALVYMSYVMFTYFNHPYFATGPDGNNENYSGVSYDSPFSDDFTPYQAATSPSADGVERKQGIIDCDGFAMYIFAVLSGIVDKNGEPVFEMHLVTMQKEDGPGHAVLVVTDKRTGKSYVFDNMRLKEIPEGQSWQDYVVQYYSSKGGFSEYHYYDSPEDKIENKNRHDIPSNAPAADPVNVVT